MAVRHEPDQVDYAIVRLLTATSPPEIEALADDLGASGDGRAVGPLAYRLADGRVQDDPDLEDAVCSALVRLGVMKDAGNLNYSFVDFVSSATRSMRPEARRPRVPRAR